MITISPANFNYLLEGNTVCIQQTDGTPIKICLHPSLVKAKNHVKKELPVLLSRAGIITD